MARTGAARIGIPASSACRVVANWGNRKVGQANLAMRVAVRPLRGVVARSARTAACGRSGGVAAPELDPKYC